MEPRNSQRETGSPVESTDPIVSQLAQQDKTPWYNKPNLRTLYLLMLPTCLGVELMTGFDASLVNGLQAVPSWLEYYNHPRSVTLGLMISMYSLGSITGAPFVSTVVDKIGRRYPIFLGSMLSIIGSILQGSALNFTMFVTARFMLGFANVFMIVAAASLIGELSHPKERAAIGCLFLSLWDLGALAAATVILQTYNIPNNWGWRIPSLLQMVSSLLQLTFIQFIPESPRWLISKGRGSEAHAILVKYHAEGDEKSEFVEAEYRQIAQTLEAETKAATTEKRRILLTPGMRKRVVIAIFLGLSANLCGVGLIAYYLTKILDSIGIHDNRTKNMINLVRVLWSFVNGLVTALVAPRYPRRKIFLTSTISIFIVFTAWTVASAEYALTHSKTAAQIVLLLIFLYSPGYNLGFTALPYTYVVELFPFHARTSGIAILQWWFRAMAFVALFANPIGIDVAGWRWYLVYCFWNALQVVFVYFVFPETSGRTLEELAFLYESEQGSGLDEREALRGNRESGRYGTM